LSATGQYDWVSSGTTAPSLSNLQTALGSIRFNTAASATGHSSRALSGFRIASGEVIAEMRNYISTLSDTSQEFRFRSGFFASTVMNAEPSSGAYFDYDRAANGDFWVCKTRAASTPTETVTAVAVVATTWYRQRIVANADGTEIKFYIDGVLVATHTTNLPSTGLSMVTGIAKTVGTTFRDAYQDYCWIKVTHTTPR
jgi:hypothetical protein